MTTNILIAILSGLVGYFLGKNKTTIEETTLKYAEQIKSPLKSPKIKWISKKQPKSQEEENINKLDNQRNA